jgi:uncharacterized protein (DUF885 family)
MKLKTTCVALLALCSGAVSAADAPTLKSVSEAFFAEQAKASPSWATSMGWHRYDSKLDDVTPAAHAATVKRLDAVLAKITALDDAKMSQIEKDDKAIFAAWIGGQLWEEKTIQMWRRNPDQYVGLGLSAINSLVTRSFAPQADRMKLVIARENALPKMLKDAEALLSDVPPVYIDMALENLDGAISFLKVNIPDAFPEVKDAKLKAELTASTEKSVAAFEKFKAALEKMKPTAKGTFVLGRDKFIGILKADLIDATPEQVLAAGEAQLAKDRAAFDEGSKQIDAAHPEKAFDDIGADHPPANQLISTARDQLAGLRTFIEDHHIITLPYPLMPDVRETPNFQRAFVFGEMDWPGPFETKATESYYYITPPDPKDSPEDQEKFMQLWNRPMLQNLSVHEALPGHFTQGLYLKAHQDWSMIRKAIQSYTATEGWAHYTEQMMLEEGLSAGNAPVKLAQLSDALLRDCRLVDSIKMHVQGMSLDDAVKTMKDRCAVPDAEAFKEARRGVEDPGYFSYTVGKLEILKLREDVKAKEGANFSLQSFHDRFLSAGLVPVNIIRREILGQDGPSL